VIGSVSKSLTAITKSFGASLEFADIVLKFFNVRFGLFRSKPFSSLDRCRFATDVTYVRQMLSNDQP
jgi:hypothetical protein